MFEKLSKMLKIQKFAANGTLKDGTEIVIDGDLDVGVTVEVITADGNQPLPSGDYELAEPYEGFVITVEDGVITNVTEPTEESPVEDEVVEEAEAETEAEPAPEPEGDVVSLEDQMVALKEMVESILQRLDKIENTNSDLSKDNGELKKSNEDFSKQVEDFNEKLTNLNGADPLKKKVDVSAPTKKSRMDSYRSIKG